MESTTTNKKKHLGWIILLSVIGAIQMWLIVSIFPLDNIRFGFGEGNQVAFAADVKPSPEPDQTENKCVLKLEDINVGSMPIRVTAEKADIDLAVVYAPFKNGTWEVQDKVANFAEGTDLPSAKGGNTGLFGHDRPQAFNRIKKLSVGDEIVLTTEKLRLYYLVENNYNVNPNSVEVFYPTDEPTLTLVTCDGIFSQQRYVVHAKLLKIVDTKC